MKKKILTIMFIIILLIFSYGITYSIFHSSSTLNSTNQNIAKFIFNASKVNQIELPLIDLYPGDNEEYLFFVSNELSENISNVSIEYQIIIKTYHLIPLIIELYKVNDDIEELVLSCDETYTRNDANELICNGPKEEMEHSASKLDNYKLKITFPEEYDSSLYADLVDYINIEIKSWQKIND